MATAVVGLALGIFWTLGGGALVALGLLMHLLPGLASPIGGGALVFLGLVAGAVSALWLWASRVLEHDLPRAWHRREGQ